MAHSSLDGGLFKHLLLERVCDCNYDGCRPMLAFPQSPITGKERDTETGLDYFGARYYGSNMGRMMSPDPLIPFNLKKHEFQAWIGNPQHWNKYAYVLNNPLRYTDPTGLTETIYYFLNKNLSDEQRKFFNEHKDAILGAIADKLKDAGIKDVVFKDGSSLSKSQVDSVLSKSPTGVAFMNIVNKSYSGYTAGSGEYGGHDGGARIAVYMGNVQEGNPSTNEMIYRMSEVASHELGHRMGFYSHNWPGLTFIYNAFSSDLMNEGRGMPSSSSPLHWDMTVPQNRQAVDEINRTPEYKP